MPVPLLNAPMEGEVVDEASELRDELEALKSRVEALENDRKMLGTMLYSLRAIFSGQEPVQASPSGIPAPHNRSAWDAWKQQLPAACGRIIDALIVQPLSRGQLKTICKMHYQTVVDNVSILRRNQLVEEDGKLLRLKRL